MSDYLDSMIGESINSDTLKNITEMFTESMKHLSSTNIINDFNVNFASECVAWKIATNRYHTRVIYVLANGETHYGPKFRGRRLARSYAKKNYSGKLIVDFNIMPIEPMNYVKVNFKIQ